MTTEARRDVSIELVAQIDWTRTAEFAGRREPLGRPSPTRYVPGKVRNGGAPTIDGPHRDLACVG